MYASAELNGYVSYKVVIYMIEISPIKLYEFLASRKFQYFFHANTVKTSCSLINQKGLLSRLEMENRGLSMTTQSSDDIDKHFNVWNDIFFDIVDLHGYFPRQNSYGPVCFKLSNKFLLDENLPNLCITKDNPIYWKNGMTEEEKYYSSVEEYASEFDRNMKNHTIQAKMFTIHNTNKRIPFKRYLVEILLDNPYIKVNDIPLFPPAKQALISSLNEAGFNESILKIRKCSNCFCRSNYLNQVGVTELEKIFKP